MKNKFTIIMKMVTWINNIMKEIIIFKVRMVCNFLNIRIRNNDLHLLLDYINYKQHHKE